MQAKADPPAFRGGRRPRELRRRPRPRRPHRSSPSLCAHTQVLFFTHHAHLVELARQAVPDSPPPRASPRGSPSTCRRFAQSHPFLPPPPARPPVSTTSNCHSPPHHRDLLRRKQNLVVRPHLAKTSSLGSPETETQFPGCPAAVARPSGPALRRESLPAPRDRPENGREKTAPRAGTPCGIPRILPAPARALRPQR